MDEIKNTLARLILLVVCLGLGVEAVVATKCKGEFAAVHAMYFGFSVNDKIHLLTVLDENQDAGTAFWALPPVLLNIFIILWIYFALTKTMKLVAGETFRQNDAEAVQNSRRLHLTLVVDHHRALSCTGGGNYLAMADGMVLVCDLVCYLSRGRYCDWLDLGAIRVKLAVGEHHAVEPV